jgi:hypothetical protein
MVLKICFLSLLFLFACNTPKGSEASPEAMAKIKFDITQIDEQGLIGPVSGKVALDYEFCIPRSEEHTAIIKQINPKIKISPKSRGRIGCTRSEQLCIGTTAQENWKNILMETAKLNFVEKIERTFYE